jgi:hypothetical protein
MFKKVIIFMLVIFLSGIIYTANIFAAHDYANGEAKARTDVIRHHSSMGWGIGGFFSGAALGLIGTGVIWLAAPGKNPSEIDMLKLSESDSSELINSYQITYYEQTKKLNKSAALTGGLLGTLTTVVIILSLSSN